LTSIFANILIDFMEFFLLNISSECTKHTTTFSIHDRTKCK